MDTTQITETTATILSPEQLLEHWQGHRKLTRRVIEAFPDDQLFTYSIGGMRTFADQAMELIDLASGAEGLATGKWKTMDQLDHVSGNQLKNKAQLLEQWDEVTELLNEFIPQISLARYQEVDKAFGMYENKVYATVLYFIDNEIHHRGQGYVYLRSLGVEPPPFWDR